MLYIAVKTHFHVALNDFWAYHYMAGAFDLRHAESLYNGIIPIGYGMFLRYLSFGSPFVASFLLNFLCLVLLLASIALVSMRTMGPPWALVSVITVSCLPTVYEHVMTPSPDLAATAFVTAGGVLLLTGPANSSLAGRSYYPVLIGGFLCGLAALFRYHGLVLAAGFIVCAAALSRPALKVLFFGALGFGVAYGSQVLVSVLSGHGPFETAQAFNVYKLVHGVDWYHLKELEIPSSILEVIRGAPILFLDRWSHAVALLMLLVLPSLLCAIAVKEAPIARMSLALFCVLGFYIAVVALGDSPRAGLPILPLAAYQTVYLARHLLAKFFENTRDAPSRRAALLTVSTGIIGLLFCSFMFSNLGLTRYRKDQNDQFRALERILVDEEKIQSAKDVFSTDHCVYFARLKPHYPYNSGGWGRLYLFEFGSKYPELRIDTLETFLADCQAQGITHLILSPDAARHSEALARLYRGQHAPAPFQFVKAVGNRKVFRIVS